MDRGTPITCVEIGATALLDGPRRTWPRGRENVHKRYLLHAAGPNLSLLMRQPIGAGTSKEAVARGYMAIFLIPTPDGAFLITLLVLHSAQLGFAATFLPRE